MSKSEQKRTHECAYWKTDKALRDVFCEECASGSEPRYPRENAQLRALARSIYPRQKKSGGK